MRFAAELFDAWGLQSRSSSGSTPHRGDAGESTPDSHPSHALGPRRAPPRAFTWYLLFPLSTQLHAHMPSLLMLGLGNSQGMPGYCPESSGGGQSHPAHFRRCSAIILGESVQLLRLRGGKNPRKCKQGSYTGLK